MSTLRKILLVDDDDDLREALSEQLVLTEDFDVFEARTGAEGMEKAKAGPHDLVILDVGLPDTDGRELCKRMRKAGVKCPILMLTGHDSDADTILGLDAGANGDENRVSHLAPPVTSPVAGLMRGTLAPSGQSMHQAIAKDVLDANCATAEASTALFELLLGNDQRLPSHQRHATFE